LIDQCLKAYENTTKFKITSRPLRIERKPEHRKTSGSSGYPNRSTAQTGDGSGQKTRYVSNDTVSLAHTQGRILKIQWLSQTSHHLLQTKRRL